MIPGKLGDLIRGVQVWEVGWGADLFLCKARADCGSEEEVGATGEEPGGLGFSCCVVPSEITHNSTSNPSHLCARCVLSHYCSWTSHRGPGKEAGIIFLPILPGSQKAGDFATERWGLALGLLARGPGLLPPHSQR